MDLLKKIKILLSIEDDMQDDLLNIIIDDVKQQLTFLLEDEIPNEMEFIVREVSIIRFNRIGNEGFKSQTMDDRRIDFYDKSNDFDPYLSMIDDFKGGKDKDGRLYVF